MLIVYATRYGTTAETAQEIGRTLEGHGIEPTVVSTDTPVDPLRYDGVIIGSPLYHHRWVPEATAFVRAHRHALRDRPVWYFAAGNDMRQKSDRDRQAVADLMTALPQLAPEVAPRGIGLFTGAVLPERLSLFDRLLVRLGRIEAGDFRDWQKVREWTAQVAFELFKHLELRAKQAELRSEAPQPTDTERHPE